MCTLKALIKTGTIPSEISGKIISTNHRNFFLRQVNMLWIPEISKDQPKYYLYTLSSEIFNSL